MTARRLVAVAVLAAVVWTGVAPPAAAAGWVRPVPGGVERGVDPPSQPWLPGHRGVDLTAPVGTVVRAAGAGRVVWAGELVDRGVVSLDHGSLRTTYEPVEASVVVGESVEAGQVIGVIGEGGHCTGCLHWGLKRGDTYLNPLALLDPPPVRLLPAAAVSRVQFRRAGGPDGRRRGGVRC